MAIITAANPLHTATVNTDDLWWSKRAWDSHSVRWIAKHHPDTFTASVRTMIAKEVLNYRPYNLPGLVPSASWLLEFYQTRSSGRYNGELWPSIRAEHRTTSVHEYLEWLARESGYGRKNGHLTLAGNSLLATAEFVDAGDAVQAVTKSFSVRDLDKFRNQSNSQYVLSRKFPKRAASAWSALASNPIVAEMRGADGRGAYLKDDIVFHAAKILELYGQQVSDISGAGFYLGHRVLCGAAGNPNASMEVLRDIADVLEPAVQYLVDNPKMRPWQSKLPSVNQAAKVLSLLAQVYLHPNWTGEMKNWETHVSPTLRSNITRLTMVAPHPTLFNGDSTPSGMNTPKVLLEKEALIQDLASGAGSSDKWESYVSAYPNSKHKMQFPPPVMVGTGLAYLTSFAEGDDAVPLEWIDLILS